jgi:tRNA 2-thiocytidine biosynthesis protein TtcA
MQPRQKSEVGILDRQLSRALGRCIADFELIEPGDRVMVCLSGGKDSYTLITLLEQFRRRAPFAFELLAVHLDQGQPGYDGAPLERWLKEQGHAHRILREDTYSVVIDKLPAGKTYCSLCSRLRRGVLYSAAQELGCSKIALGHHRDDAIETLLLNMMYAGAMASMPAKLLSRDGRNVVIRPLLYAAESVIARYAELMRFPILPCNLCGSQENLKRKQVKALLGELEKLAPSVRESMIAAMGNLKAAHLLDRDLMRALRMSAAQEEEPERTRDPAAEGSAPAPRGGAAEGSAPALRGGAASAQPAVPAAIASGGRRLPLLS